MASISKDPNGQKRLLVMIDRKRWTVRLGAINNRQAEAIQQKVEALVAARSVGVPADAETCRWLSTIDGKLHERLARTGLVAPRQQNDSPTLARLLDAFFEILNVKPGTRKTYEQTRRGLEEAFDVDQLLSSVTPLAAERWRQAMVDEELAAATIAKRIKTARQIFKRGMKWKMLTENPFDEVKAGPQANRARMFFITREVAEKVLDACPNAEWRLIFGLSRYGGLRCPSEHLGLRWADINWVTNRMVVHSPKTEAHAGREFRIVPLFPELRPLMEDAYQLAEPGAEFVITRYRLPSCNLRTQFHRILARAGVMPWEKTFHNLRSSRQTELTQTRPTHLVCAWMGNSPAIAQQHYLQVRPEDFAAEVANLPTTVPVSRAAQKAAQHASVLPGTEMQSHLGHVA